MYSRSEAGFGIEVDFDLDDLRVLFKTPARSRHGDASVPVLAPARPVVTPTGQSMSSLEVDLLAGLPLPPAARRAIMGRLIRTTLPFVMSDLIALAVSGVFAQFAVRWLGIGPPQIPPWAFSVTLCPLILGYWLSGLYSEVWVHPVIELRQLTHLTSIGLIAAAAGGALAHTLPLWCLAAWPVALVAVPLSRAIVRALCASRSWWGYPTVVIDSGNGVGELARSLMGSPKSGLRPVIMTDPHGRCRSSLLPVVNDPATLRSIVRAEGICHAVVSLPSYSGADVASALDQYSGVIPHLLVLSDASTLPALWSASRGLGRLSGIEVRNGLLLAALQRVKRATDIAICLAVGLLGLPLIAAISVAIKVMDPGPVLFGHTRIGQHGRRFKTWKFRTMRVGADTLLREHLAKHPAAQLEWEHSHKLREDPRVTRLGAFLRRSSLDELPQVWNVLCGEMSLVGPRPIVDSEIRHYGQVMRLYAMVKPGITGLWQASGRNEVGYTDRVLLDQFYVRHWSPWLDAFVLAKTIVALIRRDGAY